MVPQGPLRRHSSKETRLTNVSYVALFDTVKSGDLEKVEVPGANNPGQLFVTRDSVEKLSDKLREEELERLMELWDIEHKLGIKE